MVYEIFFCSKFPDFLDMAGRKTTRGRTQAIAKRYAFPVKAILVGPYYAGPKWRYFSCYGIKRVGVICLSMSLPVHSWTMMPIRTCVEGARVNLGLVYKGQQGNIFLCVI